MKTLFLTTAAATLLLSGNTLIADHSSQRNYTNFIQNSETRLQDYTEYEMLNEKLDIQRYQTKVETDNNNTRILIMSNNDNQEQYKSIFIKDTNRLKIIEFKRGLIFDEVLQ
ncbi:hypothetical protein [Terribacillus saccharophilus]|uniref:hypothetical protein n=1 Tax=Terribacillus saccharophilus TaxID=361277 RepID=UPI000BA67163|nr:hypothetical protein [Terribacillus saccharophilus]PAF15753.1 hypothetical protein CHH51_18310 [Terribacillus saccharophilus]